MFSFKLSVYADSAPLVTCVSDQTANKSKPHLQHSTIDALCARVHELYPSGSLHEFRYAQKAAVYPPMTNKIDKETLLLPNKPFIYKGGRGANANLSVYACPPRRVLYRAKIVHSSACKRLASSKLR